METFFNDVTVLTMCSHQGKDCTGSWCDNWTQAVNCDPSCKIKGTACANNKYRAVRPSHEVAEIKGTDKRGYGVFATTAFDSGQVVMECLGELITAEEGAKKRSDYAEAGKLVAYNLQVRDSSSTASNETPREAGECDPEYMGNHARSLQFEPRP